MRLAPKGAPSYWGCPRGKHCPYAHGHEELIGEGKREYEKEQEAKKNAEITEKYTPRKDEEEVQDEQLYGLQFYHRRADVEQCE